MTITNADFVSFPQLLHCVRSQFKRCNLPLGSEISFSYSRDFFSLSLVYSQCTRIRHLAHERSPSKSKTKIHIDIPSDTHTQHTTAM